MQVNVQRVDRLPRQAWVLHHRAGVTNVAVGDKVRVTDDAFFEGGWALTPAPEALSLSGIHLGSGAAWGSGRLTLISPSHTLESVWTATSAGETWAANSLALLVAATRPDGFRIWRLRRAMRSVYRGVSGIVREVHAGPDVIIRRFVNAFVEIGEDGLPVERQQEQAADFDDYASYAGFLRRAVGEALASYGGDKLAVYVSRGYDSPACAALARDVGPATAICIDRTATGDADDGALIADALGIPSVMTRRKPRPTRVVGYGYGVEAIAADDYEDVFEFFCGVHIADECLRAPDEIVADRAVLTGWYGDVAWGIDGPVWRDLKRGHPSSGGIGLGEFRLRTGFMHLPVPGFAFNRSAVVRAIGESEAMRPWRLGTDYDRPIPRRIVEEAGVPRELFGVRKQFTATQAANLHGIASILFDMQIARYAPAFADWPFARAPGGRLTRAAGSAAYASSAASVSGSVTGSEQVWPRQT